VPVAGRDGYAVSVAEREPQGLDHALGQALPAAIPLTASRIAGSGPSYRHRRNESPS
jgi:hypothetical protein